MRSRVLVGTLWFCTLGACSVLFAPSEQASPAVDAGPSRSDARDRDSGPRNDASTTTCSSFAGDGTCIIDCTTPDCNGDILCPPGVACEVNCIGDQACENVAIDCISALGCTITCEGADACDLGGIRCSGSKCSVTCAGDAACEEGLISCTAASCAIGCKGSNACAAGVCCNGADCGDDCSGSDGGNCSCPQ